MSQLLDIFSLSPSDFNAYLQEAAQYSAPSQIDFLRREYRKRNTLSGLLDTSGEAGLEGKNVSSMLPIAGPAGMSLFDAAKGGKLQTRFKDYITDAIGALVGGVENPGLAAKGLLTDDEMLGASMQTAGTAMLGGGAAVNAMRPSSDGLLASNMPIGTKVYRQDSLTPNLPGEGAVYYSPNKSYTENYAGEGRTLKTSTVPENTVDIQTPEGRSQVVNWMQGEYNKFAKLSDDLELPRISGELKYIKDILNKENISAPDVAQAMANLTLIYNRQTGNQNSSAAEKQFLDNVGADAITMVESDGSPSLAFRFAPAANASKGAGLLAVLPEPRNQAEANAKAILELRAQGRANEVTNDMMAAADPQYMFNNTPLDMSENARMARASELGFDSDGLHGTRGGSERSDFQSFRSDVETYIAPNTSAGAELMAQFNTVDGGKSMPLKHRGNLLDTSDRSNNFQQRRDAQEMFNNADLGKFETGDYSGLPEWSNFNAINSARDSGYDGIKLEERDWVNSTAVFNPANIRSRFARFDPEFSDLSNLSAANANASVGALVLSQHARAKPELADILAQNGVDPANINAAPIQRVQAALETATQRQILDPRSANSILQGFAQPELEDFYANANPLAGLLAIQQPQQRENRGLLQ